MNIIIYDSNGWLYSTQSIKHTLVKVISIRNTDNISGYHRLLLQLCAKSTSAQR